MLALNDQLRDSFHIVFNINDNVWSEGYVFALEWEFSVSMESVFVHLVDILQGVLEFLNELTKQIFIKSMLELYKKLFHTFSFNSIS